MTKPVLVKNKTRSAIIVQKYGGATLADPGKIKQIAQRIAELSRSNTKVVAAVSAMGKTTNQLLDLANQVSSHPNRRELDMLLTTGERVSMALVTMALHDLGCDAISFTGSQAGILTNDAHVNASIINVKAHRVLEALDNNKVVVLAGFQGVSPVTKEITTLGRGGTDTTAIAMAAFLNADRCEILKDVSGVFSADPKLIPTAHPLKSLSYDQMLEMTFWGAKVLHYRSVELAKVKQVQIYIGPASSTLEEGTLIPHLSKEPPVYETTKILGLNSHLQVLELEVNGSTTLEAFQNLQNFLAAKEIAAPQILLAETLSHGQRFFVTGPAEIVKTLAQETRAHSLAQSTTQSTNESKVRLKNENLCSITATCTGVTTPELTQKILAALENHKIPSLRIQYSAMSLTVYLEMGWHEKALSALHQVQ